MPPNPVSTEWGQGHTRDCLNSLPDSGGGRY
jgi:hypothetical protein